MFRRALLAAATTAAVILSPLAAQPAQSAAATAADLPTLLRVQAADTAHKYDRAAFEHWIDADGDGLISGDEARKYDRRKRAERE